MGSVDSFLLSRIQFLLAVADLPYVLVPIYLNDISLRFIDDEASAVCLQADNEKGVVCSRIR